MSLLDSFLKRFSPQQKSVNQGIFGFFSPAAMPKWTEKQYLEAYKGWVFACTNAIASRMAAIELKLQNYSKGMWIDVPDHPALDTLHRVNDFTSFYDLWYATQAFIELDGNAFWNIVSNGNNAASEIWMLDPTRVRVVKSKENFIGGYVFTNEEGIDVPFGINQIVHFKNFHPRNPYRGMGTVEAAALPIDIGEYAGEWQRNFFGNSAMPSGLLTTEGTITQEQYDRIKANWDSKYKGLDNAHKMALLEGGMKWESLTPTSREMQFTESKKNIRDEILGIFGTPKPILGIFEDINLASAQVAEEVYAKNQVQPKMVKNITTLNEFYLPLIKLDTKQWRFWFKDPVPENIQQKLDIINSGLGGNGRPAWMKQNEARAVFGYEPVEGGDELTLSTMQVVEPGTDEEDDPDHTERDRQEEEDQEDGEKAIHELASDLGIPLKKSKTKGKKKSAAKNPEYIEEQVTAQKKVFLDLNTQLENILLPLISQKRASANIQKAEAQNELVNILFDSDAFKGWVKLVFNATKDGMQTIFEKSGGEGIAETNVDVSFDLQNPRALDWINEHALEDSKSYSGTWKDDISLTIQEGIEQGQSIDEIKDNVKQLLIDQSDYRAERIARTEVINAYSSGNLEGYRQSGVVEKKEWLPDAEACPICMENADAGAIPLDEDFPSGDPAPTAHPNCFPAGVKIQTNRGQKNIENIEIGNMVLTHQGRYKPVVALSKRFYQGEMITISSEGKKVTATPEHPFLTTDGYVDSRDLDKFTRLIRIDESNDPQDIFKITQCDPIIKSDLKEYVYNFEVEEDHSYIADGFVVSNCECALQPVTQSDE